MREIKFRRWNPLHKRYDYDVGIVNPGEWAGPAYPNWELYPLEQYVGFRDNGGQRIYEGDRVRVESARGHHWLGTVGMTDGCFEVKYDSMQDDRGDGMCHQRLYVKCFVVNHAIEIIGNIHD